MKYSTSVLRFLFSTINAVFERSFVENVVDGRQVAPFKSSAGRKSITALTKELEHEKYKYQISSRAGKQVERAI